MVGRLFLVLLGVLTPPDRKPHKDNDPLKLESHLLAHSSLLKLNLTPCQMAAPNMLRPGSGVCKQRNC